MGPKMLPTIFSPSSASTWLRSTPPSIRSLGCWSRAPANDPGTAGIFGVGLHSAQQRGDCPARHLFSGGLINSELRGKLIHRNFGQYVIYSTHHWAFLPAAEKQRPGSRQRGDLVATL